MTRPRPLRGIFVTGTDTGVGKTLMASALIRFACRLGLTPIPFKPVETGCDPDPRDALALWRAARGPMPLGDVCLYPLRLPAAPILAAAAEAVRIDLDTIVARATTLAARGDFLVVEGAGGLLVPYAEGVTTVELAARLGLPLLVVARTALGTVNHSALTLREAQQSGLEVMGLILNQTSATVAPHEPANARLIASLTGISALGTFPHLPAGVRADPDALADILASSLQPAGLERLFSQPPP